MPVPDQTPPLEPCHVIGERTREWIVSRESCPALGRHGIDLAGLSLARDPYRMVRPVLPFHEIQVCYGGEGLTLVDGEWVRFGRGEACLAPAGALQAFHPAPGRLLRVAWVHYAPNDPGPSFATDNRVRLEPAAVAPLRSAIGSLYCEAMGARQPAVLELLAEWVHRLAERLARRQAPDARLQRLFAKVDERLGDPWDLQSLALEARLSGEQLRRLCQREYGQSPMERVRVLRMARAAALIRRGAGKLEPMALALGYSSLYAFSTAFRRSFGVSPSEYRRTRGVASG